MANGRISATQALNSENFYQLPKVIIGTKYYSTLQAEAKLLFMLCRDRMSLSLDSTRNGDTRFIDENGDIFIFYSIEELMNDLGCGRAKVIKLKKELIKFNLIDEVRQGLNKANRIYVKNAITDINILNKDFEAKEVKEVEKPFNDTEVRKSNFQKFENRTQLILNILRLKIIRIKLSIRIDTRTSCFPHYQTRQLLKWGSIHS